MVSFIFEGSYFLNQHYKTGFVDRNYRGKNKFCKLDIFC